MAVECQECCQAKASRTRCVQLTALSEAGGPCALQDNGAASKHLLWLRTHTAASCCVPPACSTVGALNSNTSAKHQCAFLTCHELMMHDEMGERYGQRARKCGACNRQGCGSARYLHVFDLKTAVTPSLLGSACAGTLNGKMLTVVYQFLFMRMVF